jgi:hypothetical protein
MKSRKEQSGCMCGGLGRLCPELFPTVGSPRHLETPSFLNHPVLETAHGQ